jgi:hypothetical protein
LRDAISGRDVLDWHPADGIRNNIQVGAFHLGGIRSPFIASVIAAFLFLRELVLP